MMTTTSSSAFETIRSSSKSTLSANVSLNDNDNDNDTSNANVNANANTTENENDNNNDNDNGNNVDEILRENQLLRLQLQELTIDRDRLLCEVSNLRLQLDMIELKRLQNEG